MRAGGRYGIALQTAVYQCSEAIVKLSLDAGAHVNVTGGSYGKTMQAVQLSARNSHHGDEENVSQILARAGREFNWKALSERFNPSDRGDAKRIGLARKRRSSSGFELRDHGR